MSWASFTPAQQAILDHFIRWRLLVRRGGEQGSTVEVAHEALFRTWARFASWLEPERLRLETLRILQVDAANWQRNDRSPGFLSHRKERLAAAMELREVAAYTRRLRQVDQDYIDACKAEERAAEARRRRTRSVLAGLSAVVLIGVIGWWQQRTIRETVHRQWVMKPMPLEAAAEARIASTPLTDFKECAGACPTMRVIPPGRFLRGHPEKQHETVIARPFAVSKYDVTFAQWDACVAAGACPSVEKPQWASDDRPANNVSFEDVRLYTGWLSRITGQNYRLLTEIEFEYAARAGTTTTYYWGNEIGVGNAACIGCGSEWDGSSSAPVGSFKPNPFGLFDMLGNVWKWCEISPSPDRKMTEHEEIQQSLYGERGGVLRGGSWAREPEDATVTRRIVNRESGYRRPGIGFRVVRDFRR